MGATENVHTTDVPTDSPAREPSGIAYANSIVHVYFGTPLVFLGIVGNLYAAGILVYKWKSLRAHQIPLFFLCVGDLLVIIFSLLYDRLWGNGFISYLNLDMELPNVISTASCKFFRLGWALGYCWSSNILILMGLDRVYSLYSPFTHRIHMTKKNMLLISVIVSVILFLISLILPIITEVNVYPTRKNCYISQRYSRNVGIAVQIFVNLFMNGLISSVLLMICNALLGYKIIQISFRSSAMSGRENGPKPAEIKAAVTLCLMAALYLACTIPKIIYYLWAFLAVYKFVSVPYQGFGWNLLGIAHLCDVLYYLNCCINWILYVARYDNLQPGFIAKKTPKTQISTITQSSGNE